MGSKPFILQILARRLLWLMIGLVFILTAGCASSPSRPSIPVTTHSTQRKAQFDPDPQIAASTAKTNDLLPVEKRLRSEVRQWEGTPHRMGGTTRRGVDCSGFVHRLYRDIFDQQIPRSTALLVKSGKLIGKNRLHPGDLVFFKVPSKGRHVGIYLSRSQFAHASTRKGVTISSLEDRYWRRCYWTARRYRNTPN